MPARILSLPFVVIALLFLYLAWELDSNFALYIIPAVLALAVIYVFSPQINWYWYKRRPPELAPPLRDMLQKSMPFYQQLSPQQKERFRQRVALYGHAREFMPQGFDSVPEDVKAVVATCAVWVTFNEEDFLLDPFERIVLYAHPFPSPQYPEHFHASEIFEEDGVALFAIDRLMAGFLQPHRYYHIGLHEYCKIFQYVHADRDWPDLSAEIWDKLEEISGFSHEAIVDWMRLPAPAISARAVSLCHFLVFPARFQAALPELHARYAQLLGWREERRN
jgi:hypothetical protein